MGVRGRSDILSVLLNLPAGPLDTHAVFIVLQIALIRVVRDLRHMVGMVVSHPSRGRVPGHQCLVHRLSDLLATLVNDASVWPFSFNGNLSSGFIEFRH